MSPQPRKAASPDKGEAARVEKAPKPKKLKWNGVSLELPPAMATMGVTATFRRLSKAAEAEDGEKLMGYLVDMVDLLVGSEAQSDRVWAVIDAGPGDEFDAVYDLIEKVSACYGVEPGE